jgi:predicted RNA methylase
MAADIELILASLAAFYDFTSKSVIHVGAGGGQMIKAAESACAILAVDSDAEAVTRLREAIAQRRLRVTPRVVQADILDVDTRADVVFFEFCLHEMADPERILAHARALAPEICILDHVQESPWAWHATESEKAARSWAAAERAGIVRTEEHSTPQRFATHAELVAKVGMMGPEAVSRAEVFAGRTDFTIEMRYRLAVVA